MFVYKYSYILIYIYTYCMYTSNVDLLLEMGTKVLEVLLHEGTKVLPEVLSYFRTFVSFMYSMVARP